MAALTKERDTPEIANGGRHMSLPVKGGTTIYQGALIALEDGFAVPAKKAAGLIAAGRAEETVSNPGADGAVSVQVSRGIKSFPIYRTIEAWQTDLQPSLVGHVAS